MAKKRVVLYLNQFFGQLGGEAAASVGFTVKEELVGPGMAFKKFLGDDAEIVATIICGDDFFSGEPEVHAGEFVELAKGYKPDVVFAGPAFAAGRYSVACGAICKKVQEDLGIPAISAMDESAPGTDMYRKDIYITKTSNNSRDMVKNINDMVNLSNYLLADKSDEYTPLLSLDHIPDPVEYNYFHRDVLRNAFCEESQAARAVAKLVAKIKGEPFVTEVVPEVLEIIEPPKPIKDMSKATIGFASDGGLVPKGNPDRMATRSNLIWNSYDMDEMFKDYEVIHAGYFNDYVLQSADRLLPRDVVLDMVAEGKVGALDNNYYAMPACTTVSKRCAEVGEAMAADIVKNGNIDAVILTST